MTKQVRDDLIGFSVLGLIAVGLVTTGDGLRPFSRWFAETPVEEVVIKGHLLWPLQLQQEQILGKNSERFTKVLLRFSDRNDQIAVWMKENNAVPIYHNTYQEFVAVPMKNKADGLLLIRNSCPAVHALQVAQWSSARRGVPTDYYPPATEGDGCPAEADEEYQPEPEPANKPEPIVYNNGD
jgi:hypothetical protein